MRSNVVPARLLRTSTQIAISFPEVGFPVAVVGFNRHAGLGAHGQHHRRTVDSGDSHGHGRPVLVGYGNSTQAGSSHLEDQLPLMTQETLHRIWREKKDIEANLENRESF